MVTNQSMYDSMCEVYEKFLRAELVEVTRCKDCKHRDAEKGFCKGRGWPMQLVPDQGFCDKGERKKDGKA